MTDRELLELAAKATNTVINKARQAERDAAGFPDVGLWTMTATNWNPLEDDGDALRLAVKLQLQITPGTYNKDEFSAFYAGQCEARERWSTLQNEYAATRRAIVRAAAKIGQAK